MSKYTLGERVFLADIVSHRHYIATQRLSRNVWRPAEWAKKSRNSRISGFWWGASRCRNCIRLTKNDREDCRLAQEVPDCARMLPYFGRASQSSRLPGSQADDQRPLSQPAPRSTDGSPR